MPRHHLFERETSCHKCTHSQNKIKIQNLKKRSLMPIQSITLLRKSFKRLPALFNRARPISGEELGGAPLCRQEQLHAPQRYHCLSTPGCSKQDKTKLWWQQLEQPAHFSVTAYDNLCHRQRALLLLFQRKAQASPCPSVCYPNQALIAKWGDRWRQLKIVCFACNIQASE